MTLQSSKRITVLTILLLIGIAIYLFLKGQNIKFNLPIDSGRFGSFGDFVAGILTGLSIFLLALSYFFTLESTELQKVENYYTSINTDINDASYNGKKGVDAYLNYNMADTSINHNLLDNINLVVTSFETYITLVKTNKFLNRESKKIFLTRLYLSFYSKVLWPLHKTITENGVTFIREKKHDDCAFTLPRYGKLSIECINYLREHHIAAASPFKDTIINKLTEIRNCTQH